VSFVGHARAVTSVCVDPNGRFLYTGSADRQCRQWDLDYYHIRTYNPRFYSDRQCRQWDLVTNECTLVFTAHSVSRQRAHAAHILARSHRLLLWWW
jgi:WD40 repeat protein